MTALVGWVGTILVLVSYAQPNVFRLRFLSLVASVVLIVFNLLLGIWSNVALEVALVAVNLARLTKNPGAQLEQTSARARLSGRGSTVR